MNKINSLTDLGTVLKPNEILSYATQLFSNYNYVLPVGSKFGTFAHFLTLKMTVLDKINLLVSKINKTDSKIRMTTKGNFTNCLNENKDDHQINYKDTLVSEHTRVVG